MNRSLKSSSGKPELGPHEDVMEFLCVSLAGAESCCLQRVCSTTLQHSHIRRRATHAKNCTFNPRRSSSAML